MVRQRDGEVLAPWAQMMAALWSRPSSSRTHDQLIEPWGARIVLRDTSVICHRKNVVMVAQAYPFWTSSELDARRLAARAIFKASWNAATLRSDYDAMKKLCVAEVVALMKASNDLLALTGDPDFFNRGTKKAMKVLLDPARFMTIPQLSQDNIEVLGEDSKLAEIVVEFINPERFPWVTARRRPRQSEVDRAIEATAELMAIQRVATAKRSAESKRQEAATKQALVRAGLTYVERDEVQKRAKEAPSYDAMRGIENHNTRDLLGLGEFTSEFKVAGAKCDIPVLLPSGFFLPLECKVSGSAVNSIKRVIRETDGKRRAWRDEFGKQPYTGAVIAGVFSMVTLETAQIEGMLIFWEHELDALKQFVGQGGKPRPRP